MAVKTWTTDTDFLESKGTYDGVIVGSDDEIALAERQEFQSRTYIEDADQDEEWIDAENDEVKLGSYGVKFDSGGDANNGWATLSWTDTEPDTSTIRIRARSAMTEAGLASAAWTDWYTESPVDNEAPKGRWLELEIEFNKGSVPRLYGVNQDYGEDC